MFNVTWRDQYGRLHVWLFSHWGDVLDAAANLRLLGFEWEWGYVNGLADLYVEPAA